MDIVTDRMRMCINQHGGFKVISIELKMFNQVLRSQSIKWYKNLLWMILPMVRDVNGSRIFAVSYVKTEMCVSFEH